MTLSVTEFDSQLSPQFPWRQGEVRPRGTDLGMDQGKANTLAHFSDEGERIRSNGIYPRKGYLSSCMAVNRSWGELTSPPRPERSTGALRGAWGV